MARGITESDVHTAADEIVGAGERPTVERIRAHLGTGSPNTVTRWLETWWQGLGQRLHAQQARLAVPAAPDAVAALTAEWWALALESARISCPVTANLYPFSHQSVSFSAVTMYPELREHFGYGSPALAIPGSTWQCIGLASPQSVSFSAVTTYPNRRSWTSRLSVLDFWQIDAGIGTYGGLG